MTRRVFLHVGSPKTGTTFLQQLLWSQRDEAARQGLLLPLEGFFDHYLATLAVRDIAPQPADADRAHRVWQRMVRAVSAWDGDALISHELFAGATAEQAQRAVASFGPDVEVHVVLTARDLVRQIPAEWQEHVKHRATARFEAFVGELRAENPRTWFWRVQNFPGLLEKWGAGLPAERVHLVTVPPAGQPSGLLWERFAGVVGLDPTAFTADDVRTNLSLGYEQAELLRRVNAELGDRLPLPGRYAPDVKSLFAESVLSRQSGSRLVLTGESLRYALDRSNRLVADLRALDVDVVGDLDDLLPRADVGAVPPLTEPSEETLAEVGVVAIAGLLTEVSKIRRRAAAERSELQRLRDLEREMRERPGKHLLRGISERSDAAMRLRAVYRRVRTRS